MNFTGIDPTNPKNNGTRKPVPSTDKRVHPIPKPKSNSQSN